MNKKTDKKKADVLCEVCRSPKLTAGVCNWKPEPHCRTCCEDHCDPEWRRLAPEF